MDVSKVYAETNMNKQFPELHQALLDWNTVEDLFDDLKSCTRIIEVLAKKATMSFSQQQPLSLERAIVLLKFKEVRAIQVRYDYQGQHWCDTLICKGDQVQLTRIPQSSENN